MMSAVPQMAKGTLQSAVIAAAGHQVNEELAVLVLGAEECTKLLEPGSDAAAIVSEMLGAAQRLAFLSSDLLVYGIRHAGFPRGVTTVGNLIKLMD